MPKIEPLDRFQSINIDFPFVQPNDFKANGKLATSFETIKEMIDRAIVLGFDTVAFETNVPINPQTGELQFQAAGSFNEDKTFPQDIWKGIEYAESRGLKSILDLCVRNPLNDAYITTTNVGSQFKKDVFFDSVKRYETEIATKANLYGVDGIRIGQFNSGFDQREYVTNWQSVIDSIRQVYSGTLGYQGSIEDRNNPLYSLVDEIQLRFHHALRLQSSYTAKDIVSLYLQPYTMGNKQLSQESLLSRLQNLSDQYPNKKITLELWFQPGQSAGHEDANPWSYVFEEKDFVNAKDQNSLRPFPADLIDVKLNQQKIFGFFEFLGNYVGEIVDGVQYFQYMPYSEADWIKNPKNLQGEVWNSVQRAMGSLNYSPETEEALAKYLQRDWGFKTLHYGSDKDDRITGSEVNDTFFTGRGNDDLNGGAGLDQLVVEGKRSGFNLNKRDATWLLEDKTSGNQSVGSDTLRSVERVKFSDSSVALDLDGGAGQAYRIYKAAFNRDPMNGDKGGLGYWIGQMDRGMGLLEVSARFVDSNEFRTLYGTNPTNDQFLTKLYTNVLGRQPEAEGYNWWLNQLNTNPEKTKAKVLADFAESSENQTGVLGLIGSGITYEPWVG